MECMFIDLSSYHPANARQWVQNVTQSSILTNADSTALVHLLAVCSRVRRRSAQGNWTDNASQSPSTSLILAISG